MGKWLKIDCCCECKHYYGHDGHDFDVKCDLTGEQLTAVEPSEIGEMFENPIDIFNEVGKKCPLMEDT